MKKFETILLNEASEIHSEKVLHSEGSTSWISPSNIAIVKYWGKRPGQIPANASLSLTLSKAHTETSVSFSYDRAIKEPRLEFKFEGKPQEQFEKRIKKYILEIREFLPWLNHTKLSIDSSNNFPHSSGIASSASAMSALALTLCDIEEKMYGRKTSHDFMKKASFLARLGSGSASRSVYGNMAEWGMTACRKESSDEYAIPVTGIHDDLLMLRDSILIIEAGKKKVSSSFGHDLMKSNPYAKLRFEAAEENMQRLCSVITGGDIGQFIDIMENEALSLHAMMMTSSPGFILMKPNSLKAIELIREYRRESGASLGFTLDAGANVHVIYTMKSESKVEKFIDSELKPLCENGLVIHDEMGSGPERGVKYDV